MFAEMKVVNQTAVPILNLNCSRSLKCFLSLFTSLSYSGIIGALKKSSSYLAPPCFHDNPFKFSDATAIGWG